MYRTFARERAEALRRGNKEVRGDRNRDGDRDRFVGMHAARCYLGALSGYEGSGWRAAEEYTCNVLPAEVGGGYLPPHTFFLSFIFFGTRGEM